MQGVSRPLGGAGRQAAPLLGTGELDQRTIDEPVLRDDRPGRTTPHFQANSGWS
jgi:hypothetical protein